MNQAGPPLEHQYSLSRKRMDASGWYVIGGRSRWKMKPVFRMSMIFLILFKAASTFRNLICDQATVRVRDEDVPKTAINTPLGHFQFDGIWTMQCPCHLPNSHERHTPSVFAQIPSGVPGWCLNFQQELQGTPWTYTGSVWDTPEGKAVLQAIQVFLGCNRNSLPRTSYHGTYHCSRLDETQDYWRLACMSLCHARNISEVRNSRFCKSFSAVSKWFPTIPRWPGPLTRLLASTLSSPGVLNDNICLRSNQDLPIDTTSLTSCGHYQTLSDLRGCKWCSCQCSSAATTWPRVAPSGVCQQKTICCRLELYDYGTGNPCGCLCSKGLALISVQTFWSFYR